MKKGLTLLLSLLYLNSLVATPKPEVWLNVFVHGIMSIKPHLTLSNFIRFMTDNVQNSVYATTVQLMRQDPIFFQNQAMQELGLIKVDPYQVAPGNASSAMAMVFESMSSFVNEGAPIENHYYTFGWSGLLSQKSRYHDAKLLYQALTDTLEQFSALGKEPKIRIMGYSHGGNVLLNLALVRQNEPTYKPLLIDELVLLGMPVQKETDHLIHDPIFASIFHIYSRGDRIQKLDFFSVNRFFSRRIFKARKDFELPDKLIQIQLKCTRTSKFARGNEKKLAAGYKFKNSAVISGKSRYLRDASPGHTELWFFSWTPANYRDHFPLNPLPAASLVPLIVREARNFTDMRWFEKPTLIDIRPEHELVIVKNQKSKQVLTISEFLPISEQQRLSSMVMSYAPHDYTNERYMGRIKVAYTQAQETRMEMLKDKQRTRKQKKIGSIAAPQSCKA